MKAKKKTVVGKKDSEAERHNPSRSAKSKADKKSGDDDIDRTGIESIMKASAAVAEKSGCCRNGSKENQAEETRPPKG
jgi:hypothetical protein